MARRLSLQDVRLPPDVLKGIDIERMTKLSEDEGAFTEFLDGLDLEDLKVAQGKREGISEQVVQAAVINCNKEPAFEDKKTKLRVKILEMIDLRNDHNKRFEELKNLTSKGDHEVILKDLRKLLRDTEKQSEEMADQYVSGSSDMNCDAFVSEFQKQRMLYWLRKVKAEKMDQLIKNFRPVAAPRSPRPSRQNVDPPYLSPMPQATPALHSLPVSTPQAPYPHNPHPAQSIPPHHDPRRMSNPAQSMPPYPQHLPQMPVPQGHPFPAAAFTGYPPPQRPARSPYPYGTSYPANAY